MLKRDFKINLPEQRDSIISVSDHLKTHTKTTHLITVRHLVYPCLLVLNLTLPQIAIYEAHKLVF